MTATRPNDGRLKVGGQAFDCVRPRLTSPKMCDSIDFLHSCHAEWKRGAGRGGVEAPQVSLRCHHRRHIFRNGVVKKLAKPPEVPSYVGSFDSLRLRLSALRMTVEWN